MKSEIQNVTNIMDNICVKFQGLQKIFAFNPKTQHNTSKIFLRILAVNLLQCSAVQCSAVQRSTVQCSAIPGPLSPVVEAGSEEVLESPAAETPLSQNVSSSLGRHFGNHYSCRKPDFQNSKLSNFFLKSRKVLYLHGFFVCCFGQKTFLTGEVAFFVVVFFTLKFLLARYFLGAGEVA